MANSSARTWGKTKLNPKLCKMICDVIAEGNYIQTACEAVGVSTSTYYGWLRKADADEAEGLDSGQSPFVSFKERITQARARAEAELLAKIKEGGRDWKALSWILERTRNDTFGQKQEIKQTLQVQPAQLPPNPPKTYNKWLERRRERTQVNAEFAVEEEKDGDS